MYLSIYLSIYVCMYRFTFTPPQSEPLDRLERLIGQIVQTGARNDPFGVKIILLELLGVICPPICPNLARYRDFVWENRGRSPSTEGVSQSTEGASPIQRVQSIRANKPKTKNIFQKTKWPPAGRPSCFLLQNLSCSSLRTAWPIMPKFGAHDHHNNKKQKNIFQKQNGCL